MDCISFFSNKSNFPKIWSHPALTQHFHPSDELIPRAKKTKTSTALTFIQPASPWIIYVASQHYVSILYYLLRTLQLLEWLALYYSNKFSLHPSTFSLVYLSPCYPAHLLHKSFSLTSLPPFFQ